MATLKFNDKDALLLFRRARWIDSTLHTVFFTWSTAKQAYVYVDKVKKQEYRYRNPHNGSNHSFGYSKVGKSVLEADDLVCIGYTNKITTVNKKQKEETMSKNVNYIGGEYKAVTVRYIEDGSTGHTYTFKADLDIAAKMKEGTLVVVEAINGYGLAAVVKVYDKSITDKDSINRYNEATAWIVNIVDTKAQDARRDATERKAFILKELDERKAQVEEIAIYEYLAKNDDEAGKLLAELKQLTNPTLEVL